MGHRRDTTADNGQHWTATKRSRLRASKMRAYPSTYNPVAGLEPEYETGHVQARKGNTMNNRRNGGGSMFYNQFREGAPHRGA